MRISASPTINRRQGWGNSHCVPAGYQCKWKAGSCILDSQLMAGKCYQTWQHVPVHGVWPTVQEQRNKETGAGTWITLQLGHSASAHYLWGATVPASIPSVPGCYLELWTLGQDWDSAAGKPEVFPNTSLLWFIKISAAHWQMFHGITIYYHHC